MRLAYVDTSCVLAIAFAERGATSMARRLDSFDELVSANLLEAELRSAFSREGVALPGHVMAALSWVIPDRPLHVEIQRVLGAGRLRGADCWHIATALYLAPEASAISFLSLDERQAKVARALGFQE